MTAAQKLHTTHMTVNKSEPTKSDIRKAVKSLSVKVLPPQQKLFLIEVLELHMTRGCSATAKYISRQLGTDHNSGLNILRELVKKGWLNKSKDETISYVPGALLEAIMRGESPELNAESTSAVKKVNDKLTKEPEVSTFDVNENTSDVNSDTREINKINERLTPIYSIPTLPTDNLQLTDKEVAAKAAIEIESVDAEELPNQTDVISNGGSGNPEPINLHHEAIAAYDEFHKKRVGVLAHINGKQGQAMKDLLNYLRRVVAEKQGVAKPEEEDVLKAWVYILGSWHKLDKWYQDKVQIAEILQNISNILNQLKNGNGKQQNAQANSAGLASDAIAILRAARGGGGE